MDDATQANTKKITLTKCPRCGYRLDGLPAAYRCPECGFQYDEMTLMLVGVARGARGITRVRFLLWVFVFVVGSFVSSGLMLVIGMSSGIGFGLLVVMGLAWLAAVVYLLLTGKHEKKGMGRFLFAAGGFGQCISVPESGMATFGLTEWSVRHAVRMERKSPRWQRLQIGFGPESRVRLDTVVFDAVVRCNQEHATWLTDVLRYRIGCASRHPRADYSKGREADTEPPTAS